jgi:hypothetical protein
LIREEKIQIKYSPLHEYNINGIIEHAGGVLITCIIVLKLNSRLPDNMLAEYYIIVGYFLNQIPTKRIRYRILIERFQEKIRNTN